MSNKKIIKSITVAAVIATGLLSACGKAADTNQTNESVSEAVDVIEEEVTEDTTEGTSFGLQDFEGLYCRTMTEQIEDYEVTHTEGYLFNGDGTGVCYGQDVINITWNETEIHFADSTKAFTMEPGKLTVDDVTYDKIEGKFIAPNPCYADVNNIDNGIYYAYIDKGGISEADGAITAWTEIYTEDSYDIVDINRMEEGDVIYINGQLLPVDSIEKTNMGIININGGVENLGSAVIADDESNCFVYVGLDMERSYTYHGVTTLGISDSVKLIDGRDPMESKEYVGSEAISVLKEILEEYPLNCYNCSILVEDGAIVEINRKFTP